MTATERAKRSDSLYYETVSVTRRVLCDMIANREADLEDAKAESEHMRLKALAVMGELQEESERLNAENAKLRELVRWAAMILTGIFPYVDYSRCTALEAVAAWKVEASEHGIEADE